MQFTIYGTVQAGRITLNADGSRCVLTRQNDGTWKASRPEALTKIKSYANDNLGELLDILFPKAAAS